MDTGVKLDFKNTENAFSYKSDKQLKKSLWLFRMMNNKALVSIGSMLTPLALKLNLPFVQSILKSTIFQQFVGGQNLQDTQSVIQLLHKYKTLAVLDYGAEAKSSPEELDKVMSEILLAVEFAAKNNSVPIITTKITGLSDNDLLIKMQSDQALTSSEEHDKQKLIDRIDTICKKAYDLNVGVMIDAEESWMQDSIDSIVKDLMESYNQKDVIVYNTFQLYRNDKLDFLKESYEHAQSRNYKLGAKLVRGAYMDKERAYADEHNKPQLINDSIEQTHDMYNNALRFCIDHYADIASMCASHNADSNLLQAQLIDDKSIPKNHPHINFCQLYGMSDNLTFNIAEAGYNVAKYVPYGPIQDVIPYLIRRAKENTAVTGDMSRELSFISSEIKRRGI
jgi:proline dehydrogenase